MKLCNGIEDGLQTASQLAVAIVGARLEVDVGGVGQGSQKRDSLWRCEAVGDKDSADAFRVCQLEDVGSPFRTDDGLVVGGGDGRDIALDSQSDYFFRSDGNDPFGGKGGSWMS